MRKRVPIAIGGGIAVVVASQFIRFGIGLPDGEGPPAVPSAADPPPIASEQPQPVSPPLQPEADQPNDSDVPSVLNAPPPSVVDVIIHEDRYWVMPSSKPEIPRRPMTREEVVAFAADVPGQPNGIVIRIARTPDAFALTETTLQAALKQAGIDDDWIDARRQLVDWQPPNP